VKPVQPVGVGIFQDVDPTPRYYEMVDEQGVATEEIIHRYLGQLGDGKIHLLATHLPPSQVKGPKIILIRDPREVAVSYSWWWMKTTGRTEEQRLEFLSDWVHHSAVRVKRKWKANISKYSWTDWHLGIEVDDPWIAFEDISPYTLSVELIRHGVWTDTTGPAINFEWLKAGDPIMYRRGKNCLDEFPDVLKAEADLRWGPMIRRFWP
jgi:hypothetical protein